MTKLIDKLETERSLTKQEFLSLLDNITPQLSSYLFEKSQKIRKQYYGNSVYIRGLIEFSNYCKNDCYYCGIRKSNHSAERYRLSEKEILDCCQLGYELGFRTFVLQGGEDPFFTDEVLVNIVKNIKTNHPDCAVTLSAGERSNESYKKLREAGADRYLLRIETSNSEHYSQLHPNNLKLQTRMDCLWELKKLGFAVGSGFMVGSPYQSNENIAEDLCFLGELQPQMVGIGPFLPHNSTPFALKPKGSVDTTLFVLGLVRLMLPTALIPSTTALGTADSNGREKGVSVGANVVMPNLSPADVRSKYLLYDNKIATGDEAAESLLSLAEKMKSVGYQIVVDRGDPATM